LSSLLELPQAALTMPSNTLRVSSLEAIVLMRVLLGDERVAIR
jgi:hypothetical protein